MALLLATFGMFALVTARRRGEYKSVPSSSHEIIIYMELLLDSETVSLINFIDSAMRFSIISKGGQLPQKMLWNLHYCHVIIFYLTYGDPLIDNIFRTVSFLHFVQLKSCSLFRVTSDPMRYIFSTGIWCREMHLFPKILYFSEWLAQIFSLTSSRKIVRLKIFARHSEK